MLKDSGLYRLYKSSGSWFILLGTALLILTWLITESELIVGFVGGLLGIERTGKQIESNTLTNKGIQYNKQKEKYEQIIED